CSTARLPGWSSTISTTSAALLSNGGFIERLLQHQSHGFELEFAGQRAHLRGKAREHGIGGLELVELGTDAAEVAEVDELLQRVQLQRRRIDKRCIGGWCLGSQA